jgi:hypothetical protein
VRDNKSASAAAPLEEFREAVVAAARLVVVALKVNDQPGLARAIACLRREVALLELAEASTWFQRLGKSCRLQRRRG